MYPEYGGHPGIDWSLPPGTPVLAPAAGRVLHAGGHPSWPGRGIFVQVETEMGLTYYLMHLESAKEFLVGVQVEQGVELGRSGYTGWVEPKGPEGAHLHFGIRDEQEVRYLGFIDPAPLIGIGN